MQAAAATAIQRRPRYSGVRPGRRGFRAGVLVLWIGFLLLNHLQPCCEALIESIPHQHEHINSTAAGSVANARDAGIRHGDVHGIHDSGHDHCGNPDGIDTSLPDFLNSPSWEGGGELKFLFAAIVLLVLHRFFSNISSYQTADHERGPPDRVYLTTLRLRI